MMVILGTIGIVGLTIAIGVVADRKWGLLPRPERLAPPKRNPGAEVHGPDHPAGAITRDRVPSECARCRVAYEATPDAERIRYDEVELQLVRLRCPRCGEARTLYVRPDR